MEDVLLQLHLLHIGCALKPLNNLCVLRATASKFLPAVILTTNLEIIANQRRFDCQLNSPCQK